MTEDELRRWLDADPDRALITYDNGLPARVRDVPSPVLALPDGADSTQGAKVVSEYVAPKQSPLEAKFLNMWQLLGGPELEREERFNDDRMWRADFLHASSRTLIEVEGLTWQPDKYGRHQRPRGYSEDCRKYNDAVMKGYKIIRLTTLTLEPDYIESIIRWIQECE